MKKREFSPQEKLGILSYAQEHGNLEACRNFGIAQSLFYRWRSRYEIEGLAGLGNKYHKAETAQLKSP